MSKLGGKNTGDIPGSMKDYAGSLPLNYILCDGSLYLISLYSALYNAIGTLFNIGGEPVGYFRVPNSVRAVHVGSGGTGTGTLGNSTGNSGGEESHSLIASEIAPHTHGISGLSGSTSSDSNSHTHNFGIGQFGYVSTPVNPRLEWDFNFSPNSGVLGTSTKSIGNSPSNNHTHSFSGVSGSTDNGTGTGDGHNNVQPSLVVTKMIKY